MTFTLPYPTDLTYAYADEARLAVAEQLRVSEPEAGEELIGQRLRAEVVVHAPTGERECLQRTAMCATAAVFKQLGIDDSQIDHLTLSRGLKSRNGGSVTYIVEPDERTPW